MDLTTGHAIRPDVVIIPKVLMRQSALAVGCAVVLGIGAGTELLNGTAQA